MGEATIGVQDNREVVARASETAGKLRMDAELWWPLLIAFLFGSFTSAWWSIRKFKQPKWYELTSSCISTGMVSVLFWAILLDYNVSYGLHVAVSIACGFTGDTLIRVVAHITVLVVKKIFNPDFFGK